MKTATYRCDKWVTQKTDDGPRSERCLCALGHKGTCVGRNVSGTGFVPGDDPASCPPFLQVIMTSPGIWSVEIWSILGRGYLPAGEIVENYRPYEEWKDAPNPKRDGFRYKLLNEDWTETEVRKRVIYSFLEARDWIVNHNPFGITPF